MKRTYQAAWEVEHEILQTGLRSQYLRFRLPRLPSAIHCEFITELKQ